MSRMASNTQTPAAVLSHDDDEVAEVVDLESVNGPEVLDAQAMELHGDRKFTTGLLQGRCDIRAERPEALAARDTSSASSVTVIPSRITADTASSPRSTILISATTLPTPSELTGLSRYNTAQKCAVR